MYVSVNLIKMGFILNVSNTVNKQIKDNFCKVGVYIEVGLNPKTKFLKSIVVNFIKTFKCGIVK